MGGKSSFMVIFVMNGQTPQSVAATDTTALDFMAFGLGKLYIWTVTRRRHNRQYLTVSCISIVKGVDHCSTLLNKLITQYQNIIALSTEYECQKNGAVMGCVCALVFFSVLASHLLFE